MDKFLWAVGVFLFLMKVLITEELGSEDTIMLIILFEYERGAGGLIYTRFRVSEEIT